MWPHRDLRDDRGAAMLTVVLVMAAITALGTTVSLIAIGGQRSTRSDLVATAALGQSEGGVAQAIEYLRSPGGAKAVNDCATAPGSCASSWATSAGNTVATDSTGTRTFTVKISPIVPLSPPTNRVGKYRILSVGNTAGTGKRTVQVDVEVKVQPFPFGIYTSQSLSQGGGIGGTDISIFSNGCVNKRQQIQLSGTDRYYGGAPAVHAVGWITTSNNACSASDRGNIHTTAQPCNASYTNSAYDQSGSGGPVSSPCAPVGAQTSVGSCAFNGSPTSRFTADDMVCYNPNPRGLPVTVYDQLKRAAAAAGTYFTSASYTLPANMPAAAVIYFDLNNTTNKAVSLSSITGYDTSQCGSKSVVVVVDGGSVTLNSNLSLVGSVFAPDGSIKFNGTATMIGTLFAKNIDKGAGNAAISLADCYVQNPPGQLLAIKTLSFRELDR